jgi:hypothetical protein
MIPMIQIEIGDVVSRSRSRARLRALLSDKRWHTTAEVLAAAGSGVSSRLREIRVGADGLPAWDVECERAGRGYRYRLRGEWIPGANLDGGAAEAARAVGVEGDPDASAIGADLARDCPALVTRECPRACTSRAECHAAGVTP